MGLIVHAKSIWAEFLSRLIFKLFGPKFLQDPNDWRPEVYQIRQEIKELKDCINSIAATMLQVEEVITSSTQQEVITGIIHNVDNIQQRIAILVEAANQQQTALDRLLEERRTQGIGGIKLNKNNNN